jgi:hypothetical protein
MTWHVDTALVERYAAGALEEGAAWSVEEHVTGCAACRALVPRLEHGEQRPAPDDRLDAVWSSIDAELRRRRRSTVERTLLRLGVQEHDARLLAATSSLTGSWLLGVVVTLVAATTVAALGPGDSPWGLVGFLVVAPLVPLAGVAVSFGPRVDPTYALGVTAPLSSARLLLLRTVAVLATTVPLAGLATLVLSPAGLLAFAWLVPSLALAAAALALSTWPLVDSAALLGVVWVTWVVGATVTTSGSLTAFGPGGQLLWSVVLAAAATVLFAARERFDPAARG